MGFELCFAILFIFVLKTEHIKHFLLQLLKVGKLYTSLQHLSDKEALCDRVGRYS